ncbi:MAG: tRNA lysidine(34) synthetase TilS [Prevotellaceae bacterium]|nr:tRNA lysidine(34) synthetase TilS [Prevotellaceae bacterium]
MRIEAPEGRVIVALSGGADSVALLRLMLEAGADLVALHCNFQLRGEESLRDEAFVTELCKKLEVELHVKRFDTLSYAHNKGISIEMAARELRYQWFEEQLCELGCRFIAVAHHQDDQAETVLLNLLRGTGLRGLAGMRSKSGSIIRPLLGFSKQDILAYLEGIGQDYVTDSTNLEREALRNHLRLDVMPLLREINPKAVEHICQTAELVQSALDSPTPGRHSLNALYQWLMPYGFNSAQIHSIFDGQLGQSGAVYESPTHQLLRDRGRLVLRSRLEQEGTQCLNHRIVETNKPLEFLKTQPLTPDYAYLDADKLQLPLQQRLWQKGDRFRPFGMRGIRLVSDFLTDLKLNLFEKQRQTLLVSGGNIAWIVGRRSDNRFRITPKTRRIYIVSTKQT